MVVPSHADIIDLTADDDDTLEALEALAKKPKLSLNMAAVKEVQKNARQHREAEEWRNYKRRRPEPLPRKRSPSPDEMGDFLAALTQAGERADKKDAANNARIRRTLQRWTQGTHSLTQGSSRPDPKPPKNLRPTNRS